MVMRVNESRSMNFRSYCSQTRTYLAAGFTVRGLHAEILIEFGGGGIRVLRNGILLLGLWLNGSAGVGEAMYRYGSDRCHEAMH